MHCVYVFACTGSHHTITVLMGNRANESYGITFNHNTASAAINPASLEHTHAQVSSSHCENVSLKQFEGFR